MFPDPLGIPELRNDVLLRPMEQSRRWRRNIHHCVLDAARVKPGNRILEFGSRWGTCHRGTY
jgi:hypothetical protein